MINKKIDFIKVNKFVLAIYAAFLVVGIVFFAIFGANLSIDFKGGTSLAYFYEGELKVEDAEASLKEIIKQDFKIIESKGYNSDTQKISINLEDEKSVSVETQEKIYKTLTTKFKDNKFTIGDANVVNPSIATNFFLKCLVAVIIASVLVIIYVGIRFRKIGGISAALFALLALLLDCLVTFFFCVIFRLEIDSNFMAVILAILGYSLNDTIVIYDRMRENTELYPAMPFKEKVNKTINETLGRTIKTTLATFIAIIVIIIVSEFNGLTTLRSFAIPMSIGIVSGAISSICLSCPLWYQWKKFRNK